MSVTGLDFVALQVTDLAAAAAFFTDQLGLVRAPASPPGAVVFATDPVPFAVREPLPGVDLTSTSQPGLGVALWFVTDEPDALHDRLTTEGVRIVQPLTDGPFGRMFSFVGPEGYVLTAHGRMA